jgi:class 3 adenylate cyclase
VTVTRTLRRAATSQSAFPARSSSSFPGDDHIPFVDPDQILDEVEEFLTGAKPAPISERVLATVLFTDLVGSTDTARQLGDRAWAELLERHQDVVRRELARFGCERSTRPATASSRSARARRARSVARSRFGTRSRRSD